MSREITREEADLKHGKSVRPQIKQPADSKKLAKQKAGKLSSLYHTVNRINVQPATAHLETLLHTVNYYRGEIVAAEKIVIFF